MHKNPKILASAIIAESRFFQIEDLHLQFSNGEERHFERIRGRAKGAVMIVPMLDKATFLLIREYAAGVNQYVLGFPKGALAADENIFDSANRELKEEIGYGARSFFELGKLSASPGYMTSMMTILSASELYPQEAKGDEPEPLEVIPWRLKDIDKLLANPAFHEARSVAALMLLEKYLNAAC